MNPITIFLTAFFSALGSAIATALITSAINRRKNHSAKATAIEQGMRSLLRAEIIRQHDKSTDRGYCPIYSKDALRSEYEAYHALGGNGVVTGLYEEVMRLPEEPPKKNNKKKNGPATASSTRESRQPPFKYNKEVAT